MKTSKFTQLFVVLYAMSALVACGGLGEVDPRDQFIGAYSYKASGNLVSIGEDGNVSLSEFAENSEGWSEYLEDNPEFLFQLHTTMFATGAVTMMPMYLIRNL